MPRAYETFWKQSLSSALMAFVPFVHSRNTLKTRSNEACVVSTLPPGVTCQQSLLRTVTERGQTLSGP